MPLGYKYPRITPTRLFHSRFLVDMTIEKNLEKVVFRKSLGGNRYNQTGDEDRQTVASGDMQLYVYCGSCKHQSL
jgi:hypothetical protein